MSEEAKRTFSREYKVAAVRRMLAGANVSGLARELGVRRKYLYQWWERFRLGGAIALRSRGRPTKAEVVAMQAPGGDEPAPPNELAKAQRRIGNYGNYGITVTVHFIGITVTVRFIDTRGRGGELWGWRVIRALSP